MIKQMQMEKADDRRHFASADAQMQWRRMGFVGLHSGDFTVPLCSHRFGMMEWT
ncbi:hypothetical protein [Bacillus sp. mrc49]|uniref:hypothetical protein n=1 Tax=Bacillus sp. mrc49 TaxID=2054913 RepID=UPI0012FD3DCA|nr:hypothetical protein [Bacillus sp. mrc49]